MKLVGGRWVMMLPALDPIIIRPFGGHRSCDSITLGSTESEAGEALSRCVLHVTHAGLVTGGSGAEDPGVGGEELTADQLADRQEHMQMQQQRQQEELVDFHPRNMAPSEALRLKHQHLETITYLTHQFGGKVLDISTNNCIVEVSAKPVRIDSFMKLISPFGILESARTGLMALPRSPLHDVSEAEEKEPEDIIDAASLPPS
ncbi:acetolactate synthase, regulatory subunit [Friedmanniomyces endolithicus]|nr:acetolactate synthase, regulatory subunit [Friedmanniomyces endolithicus]